MLISSTKSENLRVLRLSEKLDILIKSIPQCCQNINELRTPKHYSMLFFAEFDIFDEKPS